MRVSEKGINKIFFVIFHPFAQKPPVCVFCTKFGIGGPLVDVINCAEFFIDWFRDIDFVGVEICLSP